MLEKFKNIVFLNLLLSQILFFCVLTILGITYKGKDESNVYIIYLSLSSLLSYIFIAIDLMNRKTFKPVFFVFFILPIILILYFLFLPQNSFINTQVSLFFVLVFPAIFIGYIYSSNQNLAIIEKGFYLASIIVFLAVLKIIPKILNLHVYELMEIFGGSHYQAFSYICSFSFLFFLRYIFNNINTLSILKKLFYLFVLFLLFASIILSGGRGGLIVTLSGMLIFTFRYKGLIKTFVYSVSILIFLILLYFILVYFNFEFIGRFEEGFERVFSFISLNGIEMEGTSERDEFYKIAIELISNRPILGYGIFGTVSFLGEYYPHNIFLEVLLQGGFILLILFLFFLLYFFYKLHFAIKFKFNEDLLLITTIYSFILLLFSSSYLQEPFFWFSISYILSFPFYKYYLNEDEKHPHPNS